MKICPNRDIFFELAVPQWGTPKFDNNAYNICLTYKRLKGQKNSYKRDRSRSNPASISFVLFERTI